MKRKQMTKKQLQLFKKLLANLKQEIIENIRHISEDTLKKSQRDASGDVSAYTLHMADVATDTYDREFSLELASNDRELLYEIDDAFKRIEDKNFGICESCNKPIALSRLKAIPYTRRCLKCKQQFERK